MYHWGSYDKKPFVLDYINIWDRGKRLENGFSKKEAEERERNCCLTVMLFFCWTERIGSCGSYREEDRKLLRLSCLGEKKGET